MVLNILLKRNLNLFIKTHQKFMCTIHQNILK
jgi:hypothetical protein